VSHSFVRRAPDIAEEILAKTASLPESLKNFTRALLTKEASDEKDRLELPKRMSLSELSKLAHTNKVDLPKVPDVQTDDYSKVASELLAIAKRGEEAEAREIFETATSIVASGHEKVARGGSATLGGGLRLAPKPHGFLSRIIPGAGGYKARAEHEMFLAKKHEALGKIPGTPEHTSIEGERAVAAKARAEAAEAARGPERRSELAEKAIAVAPMVAAGVGTPLAAAALLRGGNGRKKEEVKIYK